MSHEISFPMPSVDQKAYLPIDSYFGNEGRIEAHEEKVILPGALPPSDEDLDIAFWNIEWFNKNVDHKVQGVARFISDMNLDVWALEETSPQATEKLVLLLEDAYGLDFDFDSSEPNAANHKQSTTVMWNRTTVIGAKETWPIEIEEVLRLSSQDDLTPLEQLEDIEEVIHGKIFDRYPGLFNLKVRKSPSFDFYLIPLHLKAMAEGSLRRRLACRVLAAALRKMTHDGADADWILGGDLNATLESGDFDELKAAGIEAVSAQDAADGAISYIKGPKSLIDHIFLSKNMSKRFGTETFNVLAVEKEIPNYTATISDHRPVMMRLHFGANGEESAMPVLRTPDWLRLNQ
jgi:endonuclease/exonuclease/phosphatase family metal-dependent hydrolase